MYNNTCRGPSHVQRFLCLHLTLHDSLPLHLHLPLLDPAIVMQVDKYTYSVCPFKDAFQKEGASKTSLGTWAGLTDDSTVMRFSKGQACWQGPARSMTVGHTHHHYLYFLQLSFHAVGIFISVQ